MRLYGGMILLAVTLTGSVCAIAQDATTSTSSVMRAPGQLPPDVAQALTLERAGRTAEAIAAWQRVVSEQPGNGQAWAQLGLLQAHEGRYREAIDAYRKAQAATPQIPGLELNLGLALFKSDRFQEAAPIFAQQLHAHPGDERLLVLEAMSLYGEHKYAEAVPYLKQAAAEDRTNLQIRLTLAHCLLWTHQLEATLAVYKEILEINPNSAAADMIAGEALDEKGDNAGAVEQFRAAEKANPNEPQVHFGLAYLLWAQKRYEEAIPEFEEELKNDPGNSQARLYLGDTYMQLQQYDKAKAELVRAEPSMPKEPRVHLDLGIIAQETNHRAMALRELKETVALAPGNVNAHFRLARIYQQMGERDLAKAEFEKTKTLNKNRDESLHERIAKANERPNAGTTTPAAGAKASTDVPPQP